MARIHVAQPMEVRESFIPEAVLGKKKYDKNDPNRPMLAKDVEEANGGAGVFNVDLKSDYLLENPEWKYDKIPEVFDGKNIYDYVDPDIEEKLKALEEEEEKLEGEGYYDSDVEIDDVEAAEVRRKADQIRTKQALIRNEARMRRIKNRAAIPRSAIKKPLSQLEDSLDQLGVDTEELQLRGRAQTTSRGRSMTRSRLGTEDPNAMDIDQTPRERLRSKSRARSQPATNRREDGVVDATTRTMAEKQAKLSQRKMNRNARQGEADRHTTAMLARHLVRLTRLKYFPEFRTEFRTLVFNHANVILCNSSQASDLSARRLTAKHKWKSIVPTKSWFCTIFLATAVWVGRL
jgi:nucleolar GTP-binding protein